MVAATGAMGDSALGIASTVENGDFEDGHSGYVRGWVAAPGTALQGRIQLTAFAPTLRRSLKLSPSGENTRAERTLAVTQDFAPTPYRGQQVFLSARLAAMWGASATVRLLIWGADGTLHSAELRQAAGGPSFRRLS